ncbi:MAG TPA: GGDEF domain-containing protein [Thermoguttaceae bacterium]|nr:GGDEF domain-containing protein [Thermoguttaceae bacterium]
MPVIWVDLIFAIVMATAGAIAGAWLRGRGTVCAGVQPRGGETEARPEGDETEYAREVLARLHQLAASVAANVGEHNSRVEEINEELNSNEFQETEDVVAAVAKLIEANNTMQEQLGHAEEKLQEQTRLVEEHAVVAHTDALTGLANRRAFDDEIARQGNSFSIVMVDVDHFKDFNDSYGHQAGDEVLRNMGKVLYAGARKMDLVARYGGEEFALILPGASVTDAKNRAEQIRRAIEDSHVHYAETALHVTASLGVAELMPGEETEAVIQRADAALYASKESGRNRVYWHDGQEIRPIDEPAPVAEAIQTEEAQAEQPPAEPPPAEPPPKPLRPPKDEPLHAEAERSQKEAPRPPAVAQEPAKAKTPSRPGPSHPSEFADRAEFERVLGRRLAEWRRGGTRPSVVLVRIDDFSQIVSRHGEPAGTLAWHATTKFLNAGLREMDLLARYDVATFAVLLPGIDLANTITGAERLREAIARCTLPIGGKELKFTVSLGAAEANDHDDVPILLQHADKALKAALQSGGNCSYFRRGEWSETAKAALSKLPVSLGGTA